MLSRYSYKHCKRSLGAFGVTLLCISACGDQSQPMVDSIPAVEYDAALRSRISVAGVSSGAYMAVQAQVAYADKIGGVAAVAGGPYHCAAGDVKTALGSCMTGVDLSAEPMIIFAKEAASAGTIAPMDAMQDARVWIFHSPADAVVSSRAGAVLADFYKAFVTAENIGVVNEVESAHGWATVDAGIACSEQGGDYINACNYDTAGESLRHLHGDLQPPAKQAVNDNLIAVDLSRFFGSGSHVADAGIAYVPSGCRQAAADCRRRCTRPGLSDHNVKVAADPD